MTDLPYKDKLCFFRCLALQHGCHTHNLERDYFQRYTEDNYDFDGVTVEELPDFGEVFELNINVY